MQAQADVMNAFLRRLKLCDVFAGHNFCGRWSQTYIARVASEPAPFVKRQAPMLIRRFAIYNKLGDVHAR